VLAIGLDICEIKRFNSLKDNKTFIERISTEKEILNSLKLKNKAKYYSLIFCIKEAFAKALKCGIGKELSFKDIEVIINYNNKPEIKIINKDKEILTGLCDNFISLTASSCREYNVASVIIKKKLRKVTNEITL
jgi:holo-[acyl-carrier protein] synthase